MKESDQSVRVLAEVCSVYPERNEAIINAGITALTKETSSFLATRAQDGRVKLEALANDVRTKASAAGGDVAGRVEPLVGDLGQRVQPIVEQLQSVPAQVKQAAEAGVTRAKELVNRAA